MNPVQPEGAPQLVRPPFPTRAVQRISIADFVNTSEDLS